MRLCLLKSSVLLDRSEGYNGTFTEDEIAREISEKSRTINIALVGNPNCGKTSFFNRATGLRERVGNYSGVTVDAKQGTCHHKGYTINLIDLPGTYSITEYTPEEIYVREFITKHHPDLVLNVVDASCLERNLIPDYSAHRYEYPGGDGIEYVR